MFLQSGELAHVGEGVVVQGADLIVAQISAEDKIQIHTHTHTSGRDKLQMVFALVDPIRICLSLAAVHSSPCWTKS